MHNASLIPPKNIYNSTETANDTLVLLNIPSGRVASLPVDDAVRDTCLSSLFRETIIYCVERRIHLEKFNLKAHKLHKTNFLVLSDIDFLWWARPG